MSGGAAVSGFVDGLFKGIGARHSWEDRKRNQKREDRADAIRDNIEKRAQEEHTRRMGAYDRQASDWNRSRADDDFWRKTYADAAAAASDTAEVTPQENAPPQENVEPVTAPQQSPAQAVAANLGIDPRLMQPDMRAGAAMMERLSPAEKLAAEAESKAVVTKRAGGEQPAIDRRAAFEPGPEMARGYGAKPYSAGVTFLPDGTAVLPAPRGAIADEVAAARGGPVGPSYLPQDQVNPAGKNQAGPGKTLVERIKGFGADPTAAKMIREGIVASPDLPLDLRTAAKERSAALSQPSPLRNQPEKDVVTQEAKSAAPPPSIPMKAAASPTEKQAASTAVQTLDTTAQPETKDATVAATQAMGVQPGQKSISDQQYQRGSQAFIDRYMEVGAPKIIEAMLSRGEFDKAIKFQEFMTQAETRAGMKDWSVAAAAATLGDIDKFGKHIISAYNRMGYFPDGTELVEAESGFTKGKDGSINGAKLTFKDAKTGNTFEQVFSGPDDLIKTGITLLAPENAFEFYWKEQQAAAASAKGAMEKADEAAKLQSKTVQDWAKTIYEGSKQLDGTYAMTPQQALAEAEAMFASGNKGASGGASGSFGGGKSGPPVAYRPN